VILSRIRISAALACCIIFFGCSTLKISVNPDIVNRNLPGKWESYRGVIYIGCDGGFDFTGNEGSNPLDMQYTHIGGGSIKEIHDDYLLIQTFPFVKDKFEMKRYPVQNAGVWSMNFYDAEWTRTSERHCTEDPIEYLKRNASQGG
jgi:hypothetical protein